jgi:peptidoglycan/LPS O-acetylase OafA/YrhL
MRLLGAVVAARVAPDANGAGTSILKYRADIDGLRAIAVLSVMAFHYGTAPGGFTGVDIFFVISGFLITQQLAGAIASGTFSVLDFYDRRIRRIVPALLVVLVASMLVGRFILLPGDYKTIGTSAAYATFGASNFFFMHNTGYFDQTSDLMPLLHTWSLGVEEQFYLMWPLLLVLLMRAGNRANVAAIIGSVVIIGFGASIVWLSVDPKGAFYLALPRAWELALGALLVFLPPLSKRLGAAAVPAGIALIAIGFAVARARSFPGAAAIYPCVGAALIVWPRQASTIADRWLGTLRPIGLISYSLYLWHWPVWVLFRHYINDGQPSKTEMISLVVVSISLATLSFFLIEKPFRKRRWSPLQTVRAGAFACLALFCAGMYIDSDNGLPQRIASAAYPLRSYEAMWDWNCPRTGQLPQLDGSFCEFGQPWTTARTKALLWGDSHAGHMAPLVQAATRDAGILLYQTCPANFGERVYRIVPEKPDYREYCADQRRRAIKLLKEDATINLVILAASWGYYPSAAVQDGHLGNLTGLELIAFGIDELIEATSIPGRQFVLVGSVPQYSRNPVPCVAASLTGLLRRPCTIDKANMETALTFTRATDKMLRDIAARRSNVTALIPRDALCDAVSCRTYLDGEFLYRDGTHLRRNLKPETIRDLTHLLGFPAALNNQLSSATPD